MRRCSARGNQISKVGRVRINLISCKLANQRSTHEQWRDEHILWDKRILHNQTQKIKTCQDQWNQSNLTGWKMLQDNCTGHCSGGRWCWVYCGDAVYAKPLMVLVDPIQIFDKYVKLPWLLEWNRKFFFLSFPLHQWKMSWLYQVVCMGNWMWWDGHGTFPFLQLCCVTLCWTWHWSHE